MGWCGPEPGVYPGDNTARVFCPSFFMGLGLDGQGVADPDFKEGNSVGLLRSDLDDPTRGTLIMMRGLRRPLTEMPTRGQQNRALDLCGNDRHPKGGDAGLAAPVAGFACE